MCATANAFYMHRPKVLKIWPQNVHRIPARYKQVIDVSLLLTAFCDDDDCHGRHQPSTNDSHLLITLGVLLCD